MTVMQEFKRTVIIYLIALLLSQDTGIAFYVAMFSIVIL